MRALALSLVGFAFIACAATSDPLCDDNVCTAAADGGGPTTDDDCVGNPTDGRCTTEDTAIFVKSGAPTVGADGTKAHPFATINDGVNRITSTRRRVYVCSGTYEAPVVMKSGASVYGGLDCDWNKSAVLPTIVNNQGPAVTIKDAQHVVMADIAISANAASTVPGDSAIGMFISSSSSVTLQRVNITTGNGVKPNGPAATLPNYDTPAALAGGNAGQPTGGAGPTCQCKDKTMSVGGAGGAYPNGPGLDGTATPPVGGPNGAGTSGCNGVKGTDGIRPDKATTTSTLGTITKDGWVPATTTAAPGLNGRPGQGGGGAASSNPYGGSGGGCGGCGGTGGAGGLPGGIDQLVKLDCTGGVPIQIKLVVKTDGDPKGVTSVFTMRLGLEATDANANPAIAGLEVLQNGAGVAIDAANTSGVTLTRDIENPLQLPADLVNQSERYLGTDDNGHPAMVDERLFVTWFVETGDTKDQATGLIVGKSDPQVLLHNTWTPAVVKKYARTTARILLVLRDNRAGVGWYEGQVNLAEAPQ